MERFFLWLIPVLAFGALAALYFWPVEEKPQRQPLPAPAVASEPAIRYPVESDNPPADSLPPLAESDGVIGHALAALFGERLPKFVYSHDIVHRVVATVDNLPRDHVSLSLLPVTPASGLPVTTTAAESLALSPKNAERYQPYVRLAESLPTEPLVAVYVRFYPLFQEQYERLGYPDKYFNDRVVEVVDHLLATPEVQEPVRLVQSGVLYQFAEPKLENLSAGQKIFLRMGRANADKLKAKLRDIRRALVSMAPEQ